MRPINDRNPFGKSGLMIPPVIYGTSFMGNLYRELPFSEKLEIMKCWFSATGSVPMIDSAGKYGAGLALEVIGEGLRQLGVRREDIIISNKLGWYRVPLQTDEPTFEPGVWAGLKHDAVQRISYKGILECWEQGCSLMGSSHHPEVVSVHDPDEYLAGASTPEERAGRIEDIRGAYKALFELKDAGLVRAVGIGAKEWSVIRELYDIIPFDWVMIANQLTIYSHPDDLLAFIRRLAADGVAVINSAVFNGGFLTGGDFFNYRKIDPNTDEGRELYQWRTRFFAICSQYGVEPGDACLQFGIAMPEICAIALNPSRPERIARNTQVIRSEMPEEFWSTLKKEGIIGENFTDI